MRRIMLVVTVALVMAAVMLAMAMPAMAQGPDNATLCKIFAANPEAGARVLAIHRPNADPVVFAAYCRLFPPPPAV